MSATGTGGCGPGPGPSPGAGSGASNPRKFSEKIALHTQRQAEETAAFQEVMMDITSTRVSLEKEAGGGELPGGREASSGLVRLRDKNVISGLCVVLGRECAHLQQLNTVVLLAPL